MIWLLFSVRGRLGRGPYWLIMLVYLVGLGIFSSLFPHYDVSNPGMGFKIAFLPLMWALICVECKRWHDINASGWFVLVSLIPVLGAVICIAFNGFVKGSPGPNRFGAPRNWRGVPEHLPCEVHVA